MTTTKLDSITTALGITAPLAGVSGRPGRGAKITSTSPTTGEALGEVTGASREDYDAIVESARHTFGMFRMVPAPQRGALVRRLGELLRYVLTEGASGDSELRDEVEFLRRYLELERIRFADRLQVIGQVDRGAALWEIRAA